MQPSKRIPGGVIALFTGLLSAALICAVGVGMLAFSPSAGANGAEALRKLIGDQNVAALETVLFQAQDALKQAEFHLGLIKPDNPFGQTAASVPDPASQAVGSSKGAGRLALPPVSAPLATLNGAASQGSNAPARKGSGKTLAKPQTPSKMGAAANGTAGTGAAGTGAAVAGGWVPGPVTALGSQAGEGQWQPYIQDASGKIIAYRTFVQPDPQRPYALTGVIAFDLSSVRLHYVIGFDDPYAPGVGPKKPGNIPLSDTSALVAAFNGGFKYEHGHFGSRSGGFTSAPPQDGLSVVALYRGGAVRMGEWGKDIQDSPDLVAFRQNGPLVIQDGQPTAQVGNDNLWGKTISSGVVTWRSGLAISPDGKTLYYFAGPSLTIHTLAAAMMVIHPSTAMQLDINNYWVHFISIHVQRGQTTVSSLFPDVMRENKDRYLHVYARDFFYVTVNH